MAKTAERAAQALKSSQCKDMRVIVDYEHECDALERRIHELLDATFQLRYFDKRDVEHLASTIDDILDGMRRTTKHVVVFKRFFTAARLPVEDENLLKIV